MGTGSGDFVVTSEIASEAGFLFDGTGGYHGLVNFNAITASGTATLSVGDSVFTAQNVQVAGSFTFDKSTSTTGNATITNLSADSISITMGGGSADLVIASAAAAGNVAIDASNLLGETKVTTLTSVGAVTVDLYGGGSYNGFSAVAVQSTSSFTLTQRAAATGSITLESLSASGAVTFALGSGEGSGDIAVSTLETSSTIDIT
jgi:hypothetical protein